MRLRLMMMGILALSGFWLGTSSALAAPSPNSATALPALSDIAVDGHVFSAHMPHVLPMQHSQFSAADVAPATYGNGQLVFYGQAPVGVTPGPPKIYLVFWGNGWGTPTQASTQTREVFPSSSDPSGEAAYVSDFIAGLGTNNELWSSIVTQYCDDTNGGTVAAYASSCPTPTGPDHVGYPTSTALAGIWYDNSAIPPSITYDDGTKIGNEAYKAAVHFNNTTASSNRSAQYIILTPTRTGTDGFPNAPWCAWHDALSDTNTTSGFGNIAYTNMPYLADAGAGCGQNFVNSGDSGLLDGVSIVLGHEIAETQTDMIPGGGWLDAPGADFDGPYEIGDRCAWNSDPGGSGNLTLATGTFAVQGQYSNAANNGSGGCVMSMPLASPPVSAPTITSFTPSSAAIGATVTVTGTNLTGATGAKVNGVSASSVNVASATSMSFAIPTGATSGTIQVITPGGTATSSSSVTVIPAPTITSFTPIRGTAGTTTVTVTGTGLLGVTSVLVHGTRATTFTAISATSLTFTVPTGATSGKFTITTMGGTVTSSSALTLL